MSTKETEPLTVTHYDNRGDTVVPYGFVYFNDGSRIGYSPKMPHGDPELWNAKSNLFPGRVSPIHYSMAERYLREQGVEFAGPEARTD